MHAETIDRFRHSHDHVVVDHYEKRTRLVVLITAAMIVVELVIGTLTNSMALTWIRSWTSTSSIKSASRLSRLHLAATAWSSLSAYPKRRCPRIRR